MNEKNFSHSKAPTSKSENAWSGSVKLQKNGEREHSFSKNLHQEPDSTRHCSVREGKFAEFENETIQKQRQEMQLLIAELRSRDRELNDMVTGHRKQLMAWEQDRSRIVALDEKCSRYEREIHGRNEEIYSLTAKLRVIESEEESRQMALSNMQDQLNSVTEQHCLTSQRLNEAQEINRGLGRTIKELKSAAGQHEQREQELFQLLSSKDRDLSEAASHIAEISAKLKRCEFQHQESLQGNADLKRQVSECRNKLTELSRELDHAKKQNAKLEEFSAKQRSDVQQLRQQLITACSEVTMSNEREQRKEELLQLQKSKQDRTDAELAALRELCEIQQRDLSLLQSSLDTAKNLLNCRQKSFSQDRGSVNYSHSQMLLPSQPSTSSFCDSPIRSYLKKSSSPAAWKDTDAADSNVNNHANLLLSRYNALRVSESPKLTGWSSQNNSSPFSLERKTYSWQGGRSAGDLPEKPLTVELDESPTKDVISSDLEKDSVVKTNDRNPNPVESRVGSSCSSSSRLASTSVTQSSVTTPWEGLGASTRTHNNQPMHGSWHDQKPGLTANSSNKMSPGSSSNMEESDDDVLRREVVLPTNAENAKTLVERENRMAERKLVGQGCYKSEGYMENEGGRQKMSSPTHVTELRGEKLLGIGSTAEEEGSSKGGCVENGRMFAKERALSNGQRIASSLDSAGKYTGRLNAAEDDDEDGSKHFTICSSALSSAKYEAVSLSVNCPPSKLSPSKDEAASQSGNYIPSKFSSTKDESGTHMSNYCSSNLSSTKGEAGFQSQNHTPSNMSYTNHEVGSHSDSYAPSKLSSTTVEAGSQLENHCPSKFSSSKDEDGSRSGNCTPSKLSYAKHETGSQSGSYTPIKLSSTKDEACYQSMNCAPSKLSSARDEGGSLSGNYCPSRLSSTKDETGSQPGNYGPSKFSFTKDETDSHLGKYCPSKFSSDDEDGSNSELYCPSRLASREDDGGGSRPVSRGPSAVVERRSNVGARSLSEDDCDSQLFSGDFSPSLLLPSLKNDNDAMPEYHEGPELESSCPRSISLLAGDDGPESEKINPSRLSSVSSVSQYSIQSLPAYGSTGKIGDLKFQIPSLRSGHWSASYEQLSEAVGKDWARSSTWNSTTGETIDNTALRQMSSFIGVGRVAGQRDVKADLKGKSEANASDARDANASGARDALRQDFSKGRFLQEQVNIIDIIVVENKHGAQSSRTISESSSHLDVYSDALS